MAERVFPVLLRLPFDREDRRSDPYYELGSFGLTGCHRGNLLHPIRSRVRDGDRLVFIQGGPLGSRLLLVTPPVRCVQYCSDTAVVSREYRWDRRLQPLRYAEHAPLLGGRAEHAPAELPVLRQFLAGVRRVSASAKLASRFRARCEPLDELLGMELIKAFERAVKGAGPEDFIATYADAVPGINPQFANTDRRRAYQKHIEDMVAVGLRADVKRCRRR